MLKLASRKWNWWSTEKKPNLGFYIQKQAPNIIYKTSLNVKIKSRSEWLTWSQINFFYLQHKSTYLISLFRKSYLFSFSQSCCRAFCCCHELHFYHLGKKELIPVCVILNVSISFDKISSALSIAMCSKKNKLGVGTSDHPRVT